MLHVTIWFPRDINRKKLFAMRDELHGSPWVRTPDHVSFTTDLDQQVLFALAQRFRVAYQVKIDITPHEH